MSPRRPAYPYINSLGGAKVLHRLRLQIYKHIQQYPGLYIVLVLLFAAGLVLGGLANGALEETQRKELTRYLDHFLTALQQPDASATPPEVFRHALGHYSRTIALIYLLGLSVVGALGIPLVVFLRGFIVGFTAGFFITNLGWPGLGIVLLAVVPQNLLIIPSLLILSAKALTFVLTLVRQRPRSRTALWSSGGKLTGAALLAFLLILAASCIEGYAIPGLLRLIATPN